MTFPTPATALFALLLSVAPLATCVSSASAGTLVTEYAVTLRGFPVGKARIEAEVGDGRYSITFSGRPVGLARIFTDAETTASVTGTIGAEGTVPTEYGHVWTEDNEVETVALRFENGTIAEIKLEPPRNRPERYVPLTAENMAGALDPVSAFLWPAAGGVDAGICERTVPLFDGKRRFDIALAFSRFEDFATRDASFSGRAAVCAFRYHPIAGHRVGRTSSDSIQDSEGMEAWIAPAGDGIALPVRIQFNTRAGRLVLQATKVEVK